MLKRVIWLLVAAIGCHVLSNITIADDQKPQPKNVILIIADDLGKQIGAYGDQQAKTPNLDRLAKEGTRFEHAYCTTASCSASRSVILSGLYNHATGHYGHEHGDGHFSTYPSVMSLPRILADAGYRTAIVGKYHVSPESVYPFQQKLDQQTQGSRDTVQMAENVKALITEKTDQPFFLYFAPTDPHRGAGPGGFSNFNNKENPYKTERHLFDAGSIPVPKWLPDLPETNAELAEYYQACNRVDQGVGRLYQILEESGQLEHTLIIFASDNGPPFPGAKTTCYEPGASLPLIVRHPQQQKKGVVTSARVTWVDLTPTILDYCGVQTPDAPAVTPGHPDTVKPIKNPKNAKNKLKYAFHGRSFLSVLEQEKTEGWDEVYLSHTFHEVQMYYPMRVIISGKYKLIMNIAYQLPVPFASDLWACPTWQAARVSASQMYGQRTIKDLLQNKHFELYDLLEDPGELKNLAEQPAHAATLTELQEKLKAFQTRTNDPWVVKWEHE
jgi:N-sulfoglucosamine sulfohydrolase